jgi:rifampicin phosphotransferase
MGTSKNTPILPFSSTEATLENSGGKGLHLVEMTAAGLPIPPGFIISTTAYSDFVRSSGLNKVIQAAVLNLKNPTKAEFEDISKGIRSAFTLHQMPTSLKNEILHAYEALGLPAVAVRSSATAEDLPDMSFAGQQDTFLNVTTREMLVTRVIDCWSSLWTARAIGYRLRQGVKQEDIAIAVVVQQMVQSDVSGVMFTANPLTGSRVECVIDAAFGLGEALVSGLVEPDHYVVDLRENRILTKQLGRKALSIRAGEKGGVKQVKEVSIGRQALSDSEILQLSEMGARVQTAFGSPQDIEWAFSGGKLYLLQTRPITSLFPLPENLPVEPLITLVSFAAIQGLVDPLTPIGQSALKQIFAMGSELFGVKTTEQDQTVLYSAGERLWVNFTPIIKNTFGRKAIPYIFEMVEPTVKQAMDQLLDDPRLRPSKNGISLRAFGQMAMFFLPVAGNIFLNILSPTKRRRLIVETGESVLKVMSDRAALIKGDRFQKLAQQVDLLPTIARRYLGRAFRLFVSGVASGVVSWNALRMLTRKADDDISDRWSGLILEVTRGMPNNPTTEMDLRLWEMARTIRKDTDSLAAIDRAAPEKLARQYLAGSLPGVISEEVSSFLGRYGGRGLCEIDLGRTRWAEDPTHVFEMLVNFLKIENEKNAPDIVFARGKVAAEDAIAQLVAHIRQGKAGFVRSRQAKFFAGRARQLMGLRESPKFFAVRMMWVIHREICMTGQEFVAAGELDQPDDLLFLSFLELKAFAKKESRDWKGLIAQRRSLFTREQQRRQLPRLLLSDGRAFYEGMAEQKGKGSKAVMGSPVSPGVVEGKVRVVRDPSRAKLEPGEIMVCPGTDPSWTPLFLVAGGLIMEVGGMMTHGAVVAREYGIPAAVGVTEATTRLVTGMKVRLNGSTGEITLLD